MTNSTDGLKHGSLLHGGSYRIIRFISSGGFGCTYEAEHVLLEKRVAIKEFFVKDFCNRDETTAHVTVGTQSKKGLVEKLRRKFIDEAKALCKLQHPGIVSVSDVFEENGTAYYVMDYIEGRSLAEIVNQEGPLPEARAVRYIRQVAEALQYVHDNNRLHLDIKPGNIMIDSDDHPVLIDFGASKQYDEADGENTSTLLGKTPGYAPPEQMGNDVVRFYPATDIYALGATLYKLLTGITPPDATLRISGEEMEPLPAPVGESTRNAIAAAMEINKNKRAQTLDRFLDLLNISPESCDDTEKTTPSDKETITGKFVSDKSCNSIQNNPSLGQNSISARVNLTPKTRPNHSPKKGKSSKKGFLLVSIAFLAVVVLAFVLSRVLRKPLDLEIPMIHVQGGVFQMGASESGQDGDTREQPAHDVSLWSYNIARHEVTQAQWKAVMGNNPSAFKGDDLPVENVSWDDVQKFIQKLNAMTGKNYRLPTEAEWEYAARGGKRAIRTWSDLSVTERQNWLAKHPSSEGKKFSVVSNIYDNNNFIDVFGIELFYKFDKSTRDQMLRDKGYTYSGSQEPEQVAWYDQNAMSRPHTVESKSPNALGIYDMSGNLAEWCSDWYGNYSVSASSNPKGPSSGTFRVVRGGSWDTDKEDCKIISRNYAEPDYRSSSIGFRLALDIVTP